MAWKQTFDDLLLRRARPGDAVFVAFDAVADYDTCVDGKPGPWGCDPFL